MDQDARRHSPRHFVGLNRVEKPSVEIQPFPANLACALPVALAPSFAFLLQCASLPMGLLVKPKSPNLWKLLQRREFPKLYALASVWVATPLLYICTLVYLQNAIFQPAASTFPIGLSAFGVTAALSGICFSMARACENPGTAKYAGEKFLHSAILLIQGLFLIYLRDAVGESNLLKPWPYLIVAAKGFAVGLLSLVTAVAGWTWYHGFSELNEFLWKNWEERMRAHDARQQDKAPPLFR
jgi:hypothetical protein